MCGKETSNAETYLLQDPGLHERMILKTDLKEYIEMLGCFENCNRLRIC